MQIEGFLNTSMQVKTKQSIFVAFSFSSDTSVVVVMGRINYRVDLKLITVKELLTHKEPVVLYFKL
jgi:hypothetical protein